MTGEPLSSVGVSENSSAVAPNAESLPAPNSLRVLFASCASDHVAPAARTLNVYRPDIPLAVVSEFDSGEGRWIRFEAGWSLAQNFRNLRSILAGSRLELIFVHFEPRVPYAWKLRLVGMAIALLSRPAGLYAINEELGVFPIHPLRPRPLIRHVSWRASNVMRYWFGPHGPRRRSAETGGKSEEPEAVTVHTGRAWNPDRPTVLVVSPHVPYPLSHGGAVRMFNLMQRAAAEDWNLVLLCCVEDPISSAPAELLRICTEVVTVYRRGSHIRKMGRLPAEVQELDSAALRGALRQVLEKWKPTIAQLEYSQTAIFARECGSCGAATVLVEHDVTLDLYAQRMAEERTWYLEEQWKRWKRFERAAWREVDRVVVMSDRDRQLSTPDAAVLPNGVDLTRFRPSLGKERAARLLFIGSFRHWPNLAGIDAFLRLVWPLLADCGASLHIIAGPDYQYWLDGYRDRIQPDFGGDGITIEGYVEDPREAYAEAQIVVVPLRASAGTNIKVLEAMAQGKAVVSTESSVHGLELASGDGVVIAGLGEQMADVIRRLLRDDKERARLGARARQIVETRFDWDRIAVEQQKLWTELIADPRRR